MVWATDSTSVFILQSPVISFNSHFNFVMQKCSQIKTSLVIFLIGENVV